MRFKNKCKKNHAHSENTAFMNIGCRSYQLESCCKKHKEDDCNCLSQHHVHEFEGSTMQSECGNNRHNHRFAGVSGPAIYKDCGHVHEISTAVDYFGHYHTIKVLSGPCVEVGNGKHVHSVCGKTSIEDCHCHEFVFATLIEEPLKF